MINFFNKKELVSTFSMKRQSDIRTILEQNNMKYTYKVINRNSASPFGDSRSRTGTLGQRMDLSYEYKFYVYKQDYEKAKQILNI